MFFSQVHEPPSYSPLPLPLQPTCPSLWPTKLGLCKWFQFADCCYCIRQQLLFSIQRCSYCAWWYIQYSALCLSSRCSPNHYYEKCIIISVFCFSSSQERKTSCCSGLKMLFVVVADWLSWTHIWSDSVSSFHIATQPPSGSVCFSFSKGSQMKLIVEFSVIAITMHEMKEEGIQMEDLIPNCSEKNMEDNVFLSLCLSRQITGNNCLCT